MKIVLLVAVSALLVLAGCEATPPPATELEALIRIKGTLDFIGILALLILVFK